MRQFIFGDVDTSLDLQGDPFGDSLGDLEIGDAFGEVASAIGHYGDLDGDIVGDVMSAIGDPKSRRGKALREQIKVRGNSREGQRLKQSVKKINKDSQQISDRIAFAPYSMMNGNMVVYNTRATIDAKALAAFVARFESQLIGGTRVSSQAGAGIAATTTFTFGAPASGLLTYAGPILIQLSTSLLNAYPDIPINLSFATGAGQTTTEQGSLYTSFGRIVFASNLQDAERNVTYLYFFPFMDLATKLQPIALQANGTNNLVLQLTGVPNVYLATVYLLAPDSKYWEEFKRKFALPGSNKITTYS
jgi:hypothetical protein